MNPEQNQSTPPTGMEYLDQISSNKPPSRFSFINRKILIATGVFIVLLVGLLITTAVLNNRGASSSELLSAQLSSLNTLIDFNAKNDVGNADIKRTVAEISIIAASAKTQLSSVTTLPKPTKELVAQEKLDETIEMLDLAKSTGNLGHKYIVALQEKIQEIIASLDKLYQQTSSASRREVVNNIKADFTEIYNRLDAIK